jgi:putative ABC transport system permease protein
MDIREPIRIGFEQIKVHKLRAILSILGILISVGSVTGIVSMGDGLKITVLKQFEKSGGANTVRLRSPEEWYREDNRWKHREWEEYLTNKDIEYINNEIEHVQYIVPLINVNENVVYKTVSTYANIRDSNEFYGKTENWEVEKGRFISTSDIEENLKVAVLGATLAKDLFGSEEALGKEIKIRGSRYGVIGVLKSQKFFGDTNTGIMAIPFTTAQKRFSGNDHIEQIIVMSDSPENASRVAEQLRTVIKRLHTHGKDFRIETGEGEIGQFNRIVTILKIVAGGIAGISLLVGGIGIMNIMLVSVTERTREIGIRKALGAKRANILWQFILESMVLCLFGGILGILLGTVIGAGISAYIKHLTQMPFESIITPELIAFAILYSCGIGLFFGVYPAYRASKLDPIEALRYE